MEENKVVTEKEFEGIKTFLVNHAVKELGITERTAKLRLNALLRSGILLKFGSPDEMPFQVAVDCAMQIPQLGEKEDY